MYPFFDFHSLIGPAIIGLVIIFIVFLISRAFMLWYWKISKIVKLLEEIANNLKNKPKEEEKITKI